MTLPAALDLHHANLSQSDLTGASLAGAILYGAQFDSIDLTSTSFGTDPVLRPPTIAPPSASNPRTSFASATLPASVIGLDWRLLDLTDTVLVGLGQNLTGLKAEYAKIAMSLNGKTLVGADFSNADLEVDLSNTDFLPPEPTGPFANFENADLNNSNLSGAKLVGANLTSVQGARTETEPGANFSTAYMPNAVLTGANLVKANFAAAQIYGDGARLDNADLREADFSNALLSGLDLTEARLRGTTFDGAILIDATLTGVDLTPSTDEHPTSFVQANLIGAKLAGAQLEGADLSDAVVALEEGVPFFSLADLGTWTPDLDENRLSGALRNVFSERGRALKETAVAIVLTAGAEWTVLQYPAYDLTFESSSGDLTVAVAGVELLTLPDAAGMAAFLDGGKLPAALTQALSKSGYILGPSAEVTTDTPGTDWEISQVPAVDEAVGYHTLGLSAINGVLAAFGTRYMVSQLGPDNQLQLVIVDVEPTQLSSAELGPSTVCPNRVSYGSQAAGTTWMEMMTAPNPAVPPTCVPSGDRWCPPSASQAAAKRTAGARQAPPEA